MYACVSSAEHRANLEQQAERLLHYCVARGYQVSQVVQQLKADAEELLMASVVMNTSEEARQSHSAFLERITVNFIRHELTEYDESLEEVAG